MPNWKKTNILQEYTEDKMGSCRVRLNKLKKKETDKWWKLKNTDSGKIHLNLNFLEPVEEPSQGFW